MPKRKTYLKSAALSRMRILEPDAAGIDIGSTEVYAAVPPDRDP